MTDPDLINALEKLVHELPGEISAEDVKRHEWLLRLVLLADEIGNATSFQALEYAKVKG